jgi:hypothetical protein
MWNGESAAAAGRTSNAAEPGFTREGTSKPTFVSTTVVADASGRATGSAGASLASLPCGAGLTS